MASPPRTRKQKRATEERERGLKEAGEMAKRFRELSAAGPNNDILIEPLVVVKLEVKVEMESLSDGKEELEDLCTEKVQEVGTSGNPVEDPPINVEANLEGGESMEPGGLFKNSELRKKRSVKGGVTEEVLRVVEQLESGDLEVLESGELDEVEPRVLEEAESPRLEEVSIDNKQEEVPSKDPLDVPPIINEADLAGRRSISEFSRSTRKQLNPIPISRKIRSAEDLMNILFNSENEDMAKIRGKIVGHVIRDELGKNSSRKDLCSVRLLGKSWLQDTHKYFLQSGHPFYNILLDEEDGGNYLEEFTKLVTSCSTLDTQIFPISLDLRMEFFHPRNHPSFSNFLTSCSSALVELSLWIPRNGDVMTFRFLGVNLNFPHLRKLTIGFSNVPLNGKEEEVGSNLTSVPFIQCILNGAPTLKELNLLGDTTSSGVSSIPDGLPFLTPPPTITSLDVTSFGKSSQLKGLLHFNLPHLRILKLSIWEEPYTQGLVSRILENFKTSLRMLMFCTECTNSRVPNPPTFFRFPRMEKLESCIMKSRFAKLEKGHSPLQNLLPNLKELNLKAQSIDQVQKWVESSTFLGVHTLKLPPMNQLNLSHHFPNLTSLDLELSNGLKTGNVRQIFEKMLQLKKLSVEIHGKWSLPVKFQFNSDHWDSLLTGIPIEWLARLRETPEWWSTFQSENQKLPSILNLEELECLHLGHYTLISGARRSLISDLAFQFAFLQMPRLKELRLGGDFRASPEMARLWRDQGLVLEESQGDFSLQC